MHPIIPQIVGLLAVVSFLLSYQQKKRINIIIVNIVSRVLYILQYVLLGAYAGAVLDALGIVASVIASKKDSPWMKKRLKTIIIMSDLAIIAIGCLFIKSYLDILPIIGILLHTGAFWLYDERKIRIISLGGSPFWFIYNFASRAYGSAVGDVLIMISIIVAMVRFRKKLI